MLAQPLCILVDSAVAEVQAITVEQKPRPARAP
jgi:hypothetical protein